MTTYHNVKLKKKELWFFGFVNSLIENAKIIEELSN